MRNRARKNTYRRRAGRRRGKPQGKPGRTLSGPLKEPPAMAFETLFPGGEIMDYDAIKRSLASYNGHLKHGHTWKLKTKIYGGFVLTKAPKGEATAIPGETPENA